ncbi:SusC/RagA family TonB-linked outer membrane protein [Sphingobacterium faecale]|uniref:SusC/RagA family TonB-linked outer membrane protein n=1 Tax=Sphingobacterium faecale TaxID=2803775 RepID=A0ABS1QYA8_9SPHI|nr:SusC/RagA family TonB-linked outer membrane protein [Sphingobacterium faecale]MBL1407419.1 SusC/RagA family TonB-linked outer membrane protein [Sphingobacterium faecale]
MMRNSTPSIMWRKKPHFLRDEFPPNSAKLKEPKFRLIQYMILFMLIHLAMTSAIPAQIITIKQKSLTLNAFMDLITQKSKYRFIYTDEDIALAKKKDLYIENVEIEEALGEYFKDQPIEYKIVDRSIVLSLSSKKTSSKSSVTTVAVLQDKVNGTVTLQMNNKQIPGEGVTVLVQSTKRRVYTAIDGSFSVQAKVGDVLVFSSIGYKPHEVRVVSLSTPIKVSLREDIVDLDDVVVTGYQTQEKRTITGSMSQLKGEDFENMPIQSFDQAMQGRMAGVLVQGVSGVPGGPVNIEIRGQGSISAGKQPLYIVDGVEINAEDAASNITASNPLAFLNPADIKSIEVLKDAAAASIYGAQAANGVVLITTKSGEAGNTKFTAKLSSGMVSPIQLLEVMNTQQYLRVRSEALANLNPSWSPEKVRTELLKESQFPITMTDAEIAALPSYDWQSEAFRTGTTNNLQLAMSGGTNKTTFRISGSYDLTQGNVIGNDFRRGSIYMRLNHSVNDKVKIMGSINLSDVEQNGSYRSWGSYSYLSSPQFTSPFMLPFLPIYNEDGSFNAPLDRFPGSFPYNAIHVTDINTQRAKTANMLGNFQLSWAISKDFNFESRFGLNYRIYRTEFYIDPRTQEANARQGYKSFRVQPSSTFTTSHTLVYNKTVDNNHNINALLGAEYRDYTQYRVSATSEGFPSPQFRYMTAASTILGADELYTGDRRLGFFTQANYNFKKRYMFSAVLRYDGSSKFGEDNLFGLFPAVSAGWDMAREPFVRRAVWLQQLKLRASYGETGNSQIRNFASLALWNGTGSYAGLPGTKTSQMGNAELRWERNITTNFGVDFSMFRRRLYGSAEIFHRRSKDLLLNTPLPYTSGFSSVYRNTGEVINKGLEIELNSDVIKTVDFKWTSTFNISFLKNKVTKLYRGVTEDGSDEDTQIEETDVDVLPSNTSIRVGYPMYTNFVNQYAGVNAATGKPMWWYGLNQLSYSPGAQGSSSYAPFGRGSRMSDYYGGFSNKFSYKSFTLDIFFQYDMGRELYNETNTRLYRNGGVIANSALRAYDLRWQEPGQITAFPRPISGNTETLALSDLVASSRFLEDASYIRLKQVAISYKVPAKKLGKSKLNSLEVYLHALNLATWTKWTGYDPEFYIDESNFTSNVGQIPQSKTFTVGVSASF